MIIKTSEIEYGRTVIISRPDNTFSIDGDCNNTSTIIIPSINVDIQQSLQIRNHISEDTSGSSDNSVWFMFCTPQLPLQEGDIVYDGERTFIIDSVGDWGSHAECVMRLI